MERIHSERDDDHLLLPTTAYPPSPTRLRRRQHSSWPFPSRRTLLYLPGAILVTLVLGITLSGLWQSPTSYWFVAHKALAVEECLSPLPTPPTAEPWTLDQIRAMVDSTRGYYARDYSMWLGWNNMRYIIEAGLLHASLLNRTLIIPSFVYARGCEFQLDACAAFLEMVNRGDAIGWEEWRNLPIEKQMGWKIPIGLMIDMDHLRTRHAVVTVKEYLELQSLPPSLEQGNGQWSDSAYHSHARPIPNSWWDPSGVIRVDHQQPSFMVDENDLTSSRAFASAKAVSEKLEGLMRVHGTNLLNWNSAHEALQDTGLTLEEVDQMEQYLRAAGFETLYTYEGSRGTDFTKSVAVPMRQVARMSEVHGVVDDFGSWTDEVVHLQGELHLDRKPGSLRFTSADSAESFSRLVLYDTRTLPEVAKVANRIAERMRERTGGRLWRAAHVRRGDFMRIGWAEHRLERHLQSVKSKLRQAADVLRSIRETEQAEAFEVPGAHPNRELFEYDLPREEDLFYIATDEREPAALDYIRSQGGILIMDLLEPADRHLMGWPLLITDILALVEQHVLARASYFYGTGLSSVTGGVLNLRALEGWDPRTTLID